MITVRGAVRAILLITLSAVVCWSAVAAPTVQPDPPAVGSEAPGFELQSLDGDTYALEELRGESPLLLVFFRGAW